MGRLCAFVLGLVYLICSIALISNLNKLNENITVIAITLIISILGFYCAFSKRQMPWERLL